MRLGSCQSGAETQGGTCGPIRRRSQGGLPLLGVLATLGFTEWRTRKNGTQWWGACPIHDAKRNKTSFSFDTAGKFNCFSCGAKGRGAIDLVMRVRQVGFREAVELLKGLNLDAVQIPAPVVVDEPAVKENSPFKGSYDKFKVESAWLRERGFTQDTLDRYEVFEYRNDKRRSVYNGSVMLKIRRWSDGEAERYLSRNVGEIVDTNGACC